jgi:hypothetical protein
VETLDALPRTVAACMTLSVSDDSVLLARAECGGLTASNHFSSRRPPKEKHIY